MQAWTTYPNTPESDAKPTVMHTVRLDDGREVNVMASDPCDAISRVQRQQQEQDGNTWADAVARQRALATRYEDE